MSISIVTVTYNSSRVIDKFFRSILNQDYPIENINITIVDNNSPDKVDLIPIINKYSKLLPIKAIYRKGNYGFADSCNLGSKGSLEHILFLNPDTQLRKKSLSLLEEHMLLNKAKIAGGIASNEKTRTIHRTVFNLVNLKIMLLEFCNIGKLLSLESGFYINQSNVLTDVVVDGVGGGYMLIDREVFKNLRGFDTRFFMYLEDVDICKRAKEGGHKIIYCPHSSINHIGGASSNNKHRIAHAAWFNSREYYAYKHFNFITSTLLIMIYKIERFLLSVRESISK